MSPARINLINQVDSGLIQSRIPIRERRRRHKDPKIQIQEVVSIREASYRGETDSIGPIDSGISSIQMVFLDSVRWHGNSELEVGGSFRFGSVIDLEIDFRNGKIIV